MLKRCLFTVALVVCARSANTAPVPESTTTAPFLVARIQPIEKLFDDAKFLAGKFGKVDASKEFEAQVLKQIGAGSLADTGVDPKKPSAVYVFLKGDIADSIAVAMLPVSNQKAILEFVGKFEVKAEKLEEGFYSLAMPEKTPVYVRFANDYAYVTSVNKEAVSVAAIVPPSRVFTATETAVIAVSIRPDQIPESIRKVALAELSDYLKSLVEDDEDEAAAELNKTEGKFVESWLDSIAQGGKELTLKANFDRKSGELAFDFGMTVKTGSKLATDIAAIKAGSSLFTKMMAGGAINFATNARTDTEYGKELAQLLPESGADQLMDWLDLDDTDEKVKANAVEFCKSLMPSLETGELDVALSIRPLGERYVMLLGSRVKDGKKVDAAFRKLVSTMSEEKKKKITLDAQTAGEIKLHRIESDEGDTRTEKVYGKPFYWLAIRDDAAIIGYGTDAEKAVAETIGQLELKPAPNVQLDVSVKHLQVFCDAIMPDIYPKLKDAFGDGADKVRIFVGNLEGGSQFKATMSMSLQTMVGISMAVGEMFDGLGIPVMPAVPPAPQPAQPPPPPA
ncbi:MAG: hypothetical protein ACJ8C4_11560 [Gemmataceae bacterium]